MELIGKSFAERRQQVKRALRSRYHFGPDQAQHILMNVEAATTNQERVALIACALRHADTNKPHLDPPKILNRLTAEEWCAIAERLADQAQQLCQRFATGLDQVLVVARAILIELDSLTSGEERAVALTMLLRKLAPYEMIPAGSMSFNEAELGRVADNDFFLHVRGMLYTARRAGRSPKELLALFANLCAEAKSHEERMILINLATLTFNQQQTSLALPVSGLFLEALAQLLAGE